MSNEGTIKADITSAFAFSSCKYCVLMKCSNAQSNGNYYKMHIPLITRPFNRLHDDSET